MYNAKKRSRANFDRQAAIYDTASFGAHARKLYPILLAQLAQIPTGGCWTWAAAPESCCSRWPAAGREGHIVGWICPLRWQQWPETSWASWPR